MSSLVVWGLIFGSLLKKMLDLQLIAGRYLCETIQRCKGQKSTTLIRWRGTTHKCNCVHFPPYYQTKYFVVLGNTYVVEWTKIDMAFFGTLHSRSLTHRVNFSTNPANWGFLEMTGKSFTLAVSIWIQNRCVWKYKSSIQAIQKSQRIPKRSLFHLTNTAGLQSPFP